MKREIKFRIWDNLDKKMYRVRNIDFLANGIINNIRTVVPHQISEDGDVDWDFPIRRNGEYEIEQYTGLKDKNGVEIYEGDILKTENTINLIVGFNNGAFTVNNIYPIKPLIERLLDYGDAEIIGNIHENKELLNIKL